MIQAYYFCSSFSSQLLSYLLVSNICSCFAVVLFAIGLDIFDYKFDRTCSEFGEWMNVAGFFLSVFFSKAKLGAIVAPFVHFGGIMPRYIFFRASDGQAIAGKSVAGLLPQTAFTFGTSLIEHRLHIMSNPLNLKLIIGLNSCRGRLGRALRRREFWHNMGQYLRG